MTLWTELARTATAAGDEIMLRRRGSIHEIRFNGIELMSNLTWRSEALLAERSLRLHDCPDAHVLIGGLGKLKRLLAEHMLDMAAMKELLSKMATPAVKREAVAHLKAHLGLSERRTCP